MTMEERIRLEQTNRAMNIHESSGFRQGVEYEHEYLTKWHDPKEMPKVVECYDHIEFSVYVLCKFTNDCGSIRYASLGAYRMECDHIVRWVSHMFGFEMVGWRYIEEE